MKIPYIKIPIADVSAYLAPFSFEEKGKIFQAVLDFGLYQKWTDLELSERGQIGYAAVKEIVENEIKSYRKFCKEQKEKAKKMWDKKQNHDEATALPTRYSQTETETKQETETDINKILTAQKSADSKPKPKRELNDLQKFAVAVADRFEEPMDKVQLSIWYKRNCRCLTDILNFCGKNITLGLETISVCVRRLEKAGLSGGYEAVARNLPEYMAQAKKQMEVANAGN